jgi:hypothetical protein
MVEQTSGSQSRVIVPRRDSGYAAARTVEIRAQNTRYETDESARRAIDRLTRRLSAEEPLRRDVPPGFYLNVRV